MPALFRVEAIGFLPSHRRRVRSEDIRIDPQCPTNVRKEGGLEAAPFGGRHTADLRVEAVSVMDIVVDLDRKENRRQHDAVSIVRRQDSRCCADPSVDVDKGDDESLVGAQAVAMDKFNKKMREHSSHFKQKFAELLEQQKNAQFPGK